MRLASFKGDIKPEIGIYSFGNDCDKKPAAQFEFDVSKFRDPVGQAQFNKAVGTQADVRDWVGQDKRIPALIQQCRILAEDLIRPHKKDGKDEQISAWLSLSFRDHHGKWISPAVAELVANALDADGFKIVVCHHNLDPTLS